MCSYTSQEFKKKKKKEKTQMIDFYFEHPSPGKRKEDGLGC